MMWFPITDFFLKRLCTNNVKMVYRNRFLHFLRKLKIPIIGYYFWEIVLQKVSER